MLESIRGSRGAETQRFRGDELNMERRGVLR